MQFGLQGYVPLHFALANISKCRVEGDGKPLARGAIIYYPPQPPDLGPELDSPQFGVAPHSDYGCLTLLWQEDCGGLQVQAKDGSWIPAPP